MESFQPSSFNPFALITDPQSVFAAIERSERLARLKSRVYHPLDKPVLDNVQREAAALADVVIEAETALGRALGGEASAPEAGEADASFLAQASMVAADA